MAAVTVEDCLKLIPNRFELSLIASYRAKQLMNGSPKLYVSDKVEKSTVVALREIAANLLDINEIKKELQNLAKNQALFKNFDDTTVYDTKKDSETDVNVDNSLDDSYDSENLSDDIDEDDDENSDEYYDSLNNEDSLNSSEEDLEDK